MSPQTFVARSVQCVEEGAHTGGSDSHQCHLACVAGFDKSNARGGAMAISATASEVRLHHLYRACEKTFRNPATRHTVESLREVHAAMGASSRQNPWPSPPSLAPLLR